LANRAAIFAKNPQKEDMPPAFGESNDNACFEDGESASRVTTGYLSGAMGLILFDDSPFEWGDEGLFYSMTVCLNGAMRASPYSIKGYLSGAMRASPLL